MSMLNFVRSLVPTFRKNAILSSVELTLYGLRTVTLPALDAGGQHFAEVAISSKDGKDQVQVYEKRLGKVQGNNVVQDVHAILSNAALILDFVADKAKNLFSDYETNISLTYAKATGLRLVECAEFASVYAIKWLNLLYVYETASLDSETRVRDNLKPDELIWLEKNYPDFLMALLVLSKPVKEIEAGMKGLPDALITELTESTFPSTIGQAKIDPFSMRQLSAAVNPFYLIGMLVADQQAKGYDAKKAELELLQMRLLYLKKLNEKKPDARLQRQIDYMANRVARLNFDLAKLQKEYLHD